MPGQLSSTRRRLWGSVFPSALLGEAIRGRRDEVIQATKCGLVWHTAKRNFFVDQK
jgi:hypothetical protein